MKSMYVRKQFKEFYLISGFIVNRTCELWHMLIKLFGNGM